MIRRLALFALLAGLAVFALTCGSTPTPKCQRSNCSGCCTADNTCLGEARQSAQACGVNGAACAACSGGAACVAMVCGGAAGAGGQGGSAGGAGGTGGTGGTGGGGPCGAVGEACCGTTCNVGLSCSRNQCQPIYDAGPCGGSNEPCCNGTVCINPYACQAGTCRSAADAGVDGGTQRGVGEPCSVSGECVDGLCQIVGNFTGGYCTKNCTTQANCPVGSQCSTNPSGGANLCLRDCSPAGSAPGSCRAGYTCEKAHSSMSGSPVCTPACQSIATCGTAPTCDPRGFCCGSSGYACCSGSVCNSGSTCTAGYCVTSSCGALNQGCCSGVCTATGTVCSGGTTCVACGGAGQTCCAGNTCTVGTCTSGTCQGSALVATGGPCTNYTQCQGGSCFTPQGNIWVGGMCSQVCNPPGCAVGSSCTPYINASASYCLQNCAFDGGQSSCRSSYVCERLFNPVFPELGMCSPACTNSGDCGGLPCQSGFCCGKPGYRCCSGNTCPTSGTCSSLGYCQ